MKNSFWQDRPTLVTGGTGLLGGWLVRRLLERGADIVCLVRDWVPRSELVRAQFVERVKVVRGDVCDQTLLERILGEYEISAVFHLAAQTIVGIANRNPISTFETNIRGTWALLEACRRSPNWNHFGRMEMLLGKLGESQSWCQSGGLLINLYKRSLEAEAIPLMENAPGIMQISKPIKSSGLIIIPIFWGGCKG